MRSSAATPSSPPRSFPDDSFRDDFRLAAASEAAAKDSTSTATAKRSGEGLPFTILPMRKTAEQNKKNERAAVYRPPGVGSGITTRPRNWHMFRIQTKGATMSGGGGDGKMSGASSPLPLAQTNTEGIYTDTECSRQKQRERQRDHLTPAPPRRSSS